MYNEINTELNVDLFHRAIFFSFLFFRFLLLKGKKIIFISVIVFGIRMTPFKCTPLVFSVDCLVLLLLLYTFFDFMMIRNSILYWIELEKKNAKKEDNFSYINKYAFFELFTFMCEFRLWTSNTNISFTFVSVALNR